MVNIYLFFKVAPAPTNEQIEKLEEIERNISKLIASSDLEKFWNNSCKLDERYGWFFFLVTDKQANVLSLADVQLMVQKSFSELSIPLAVEKAFAKSLKDSKYLSFEQFPTFLKYLLL